MINAFCQAKQKQHQKQPQQVEFGPTSNSFGTRGGADPCLLPGSFLIKESFLDVQNSSYIRYIFYAFKYNRVRISVCLIICFNIIAIGLNTNYTLEKTSKQRRASLWFDVVRVFQPYIIVGMPFNGGQWGACSTSGQEE